MSEQISFAKQDIVWVLKRLNELVVSLDRLTSAHVDLSPELWKTAVLEYFLSSEALKALPRCRSILSQSFSTELGPDDMDELERAMEDCEYWSFRSFVIKHAGRPDILKENTSNPSLVTAFLRTFRRLTPDTPSNLPTACSLQGKKARTLSELKGWTGDEEVFIYWDQGMSLRKDLIRNVTMFWEGREPWEDYDFCIFPESLDWCVGFTHNDYCVLVEVRKMQDLNDPSKGHLEKRKI